MALSDESGSLIGRHFVAYEDGGPSGPCGQAVSITSPWQRLYVYANAADAEAFIKHTRQNPTYAGRRGRKIVGYWSDDGWLGGLAQPGDIVPEYLR